MQIRSSNAHCGLLLSKTTNEHNAHPNYKFWHQSFFKRIMNETMLDAEKLYTFWTHIDYFASDTLFNISLLYHLMWYKKLCNSNSIDRIGLCYRKIETLNMKTVRLKWSNVFNNIHWILFDSCRFDHMNTIQMPFGTHSFSYFKFVHWFILRKSFDRLCIETLALDIQSKSIPLPNVSKPNASHSQWLIWCWNSLLAQNVVALVLHHMVIIQNIGFNTNIKKWILNITVWSWIGKIFSEHAQILIVCCW